METDVEDEHDEQISPLNERNQNKTLARATRFLSIFDPTSQLPNPQALMKLRQMHDETLLSDEVFDKIPFQ